MADFFPFFARWSGRPIEIWLLFAKTDCSGPFRLGVGVRRVFSSDPEAHKALFSWPLRISLLRCFFSRRSVFLSSLPRVRLLELKVAILTQRQLSQSVRAPPRIRTSPPLGKGRKCSKTPQLTDSLPTFSTSRFFYLRSAVNSQITAAPKVVLSRPSLMHCNENFFSPPLTFP